MALAAMLPLSHFGMGFCSFLLLLNWIAEWNWKEKLHLLKQQRQGLVFSALYVVSCIGLLKTDNWPQAGQYLLNSLPVLLAPLIIITSPPFNASEMNRIFKAVIGGTLFAVVCSLVFWLTRPVQDIRQISIFIDHIRFSLCVVFSMVLSIRFSVQYIRNKDRRFWLYVSVLLFLLFYLFISQTMTGLVLAFVLCIAGFFFQLRSKMDIRGKLWMLCFITVLFIVSGGYAVFITWDYYHDRDKQIAETVTELGNPYDFDTGSILENGHRIGYYVCPSELQAAWELRSDTAYTDLVQQTLVRYLNSMGQHKDYRAVMSLSDADIRRVEQQVANVAYFKELGLRKSLYQTFYSVSVYQQSGKVDGSSLLQRFELWGASLRVLSSDWYLGVGMGDVKSALNAQLEKQHSSIVYRRIQGCHNQYITFMMMGGILVVAYFVFLMIYPLAAMRKRLSSLYIMLSIIIFLSCLVEDTIDSQTGRMLYSVFLPLLLFGGKEDID